MQKVGTKKAAEILGTTQRAVLYLRVNGTPGPEFTLASPGAETDMRMSFQATLELAPRDKVEVCVWHAVGEDLKVIGGLDKTWINITRQA